MNNDDDIKDINIELPQEIFNRYGNKLSRDKPSKLIVGKWMISAIIKDHLEEFKDLSIEYIRNNSFGCQLPNECDANSLSTMLKSSSYGNGIEFDILLNLHIPGETNQEEKEIFLNVELQNKQNPGYDLYNRATVYVSRMISNQKDETSVNLYKNLKKVYSIWIIFETNKKYSNTCTSISHHATLKEGKNIYNIESNHEIIFIFIDISKENKGYRDSIFLSTKILGAIFSLNKDKEDIDYINTLLEKNPKGLYEDTEAMLSYVEVLRKDALNNVMPQIYNLKKDKEKAENRAKEAENRAEEAENRAEEAKNRAEEAERQKQEEIIKRQEAEIKNQQLEAQLKEALYKLKNAEYKN